MIIDKKYAGTGLLVGTGIDLVNERGIVLARLSWRENKSDFHGNIANSGLATAIKTGYMFACEFVPTHTIAISPTPVYVTDRWMALTIDQVNGLEALKNPTDPDTGEIREKISRCFASTVLQANKDANRLRLESAVRTWQDFVDAPYPRTYPGTPPISAASHCESTIPEGPSPLVRLAQAVAMPAAIEEARWRWRLRTGGTIRVDAKKGGFLILSFDAGKYSNARLIREENPFVVFGSILMEETDRWLRSCEGRDSFESAKLTTGEFNEP